MKIVKNPCTNCKPPQRHAHCHCEGQCAKGTAYEEYVAFKRELNQLKYRKNLLPEKKGIPQKTKH